MTHVIRWQIGQTAICHCTGSPRHLAVLRGGAGRLPVLDGETPSDEPHECPTAQKRSKLGRPRLPESETIRLSAEAMATARTWAAEAATTPRALIEGIMATHERQSAARKLACWFCRHVEAECHCGPGRFSTTRPPDF